MLRSRGSSCPTKICFSIFISFISRGLPPQSPCCHNRRAWFWFDFLLRVDAFHPTSSLLRLALLLSSLSFCVVLPASAYRPACMIITASLPTLSASASSLSPLLQLSSTTYTYAPLPTSSALVPTLTSHSAHNLIHVVALVASRTVAEPATDALDQTSTGFDAAANTAYASATSTSLPTWSTSSAGDGALAALLVVPLVFALWLWVGICSLCFHSFSTLA